VRTAGTVRSGGRPRRRLRAIGLADELDGAPPAGRRREGRLDRAASPAGPQPGQRRFERAMRLGDVIGVGGEDAGPQAAGTRRQPGRVGEAGPDRARPLSPTLAPTVSSSAEATTCGRWLT
jgi:hypothetical protein